MNDSTLTGGLELISPVFRNGGPIPAQYTCRGHNVNPPLNILGVSKDVKSLVLIVHDPDAPNKDFTHWLVWDIPASTESITVNSVPIGAFQGTNDAGQNAYMGPCPPSGIHHYQFELYTLDTMLGTGSRNRQQLQKDIDGHVIASTTLVGTFAANDQKVE